MSLGLILNFCCIPLVHLPIHAPVPHCFDYNDFHVVIPSKASPKHLFFFSVFLAIPACLFFYMNFRINLSDCIKWFADSFLGTALTLQINLGRIYIFVMFSHPIQEQGISFYLFKPISLSFSSAL